MDEDEKCVFYPSAGTGGQVLAMNGTPSIEVSKMHSKWASFNRKEIYLLLTYYVQANKLREAVTKNVPFLLITIV